MVSGWRHNPRFIVVGSSRLNYHGWKNTKLYGSRKLFGCLSENSDWLPPGWNKDDQQEEGCKSKVWDPGIQSNNKHSWGLVTCLILLEGSLHLVWDPGGHWNYKDWWEFLDEFKHKPP